MTEDRAQPRRVTRRRFMVFGGAMPVATLLAACSASKDLASGVASEVGLAESQPEPAPTATLEPPFVVAAGEERRLLMQGTPQETPLYVFGSGLPGRIMMVLGGVHGNEPGGWMAAERLVKEMRPAAGALLVVPRANAQAIPAFVRTTDELGDLNRLYPGDPAGLPMERMAYEIVETLREFRVDTLIDMHESWAFYKDRPQNGTAFLGQTVATSPSEPSASFARGVVEAVNTRIRAPQEELFFREFPPGRLPEPASRAPLDTSGNPQAAVSGGSRSSLGLPRYLPDLLVLLVEMGQQQALERRIALHLEVTGEVARRIGL